MGLIIHPFFFAFHLLDFFRISLLKNVIKSIYRPKDQLILTLTAYFIFEWYFSLIGYLVLNNDYKSLNYESDYAG